VKTLGPVVRRLSMVRRWIVPLLLLLLAADARAQLTCAPARLRAGFELRIDSPGAFGASPSAGVVLTYRNTAGGTATPFGAAHSWSAGEVSFLLPVGFPTGTYEVVLSSPAGAALRNPACFTVDPALVAAPLARRTVVAGGAHTLDMAVDGDLPWDGDTKITLWGKNFQPGTEASGPPWTAGKTWVELSGDGRPYPPTTRTFAPPRIVIRDAGTIEVTVSKYILLIPGLKARVWFPDGTKSAWQYVRTDWDHDGTGTATGGGLSIVH
jgi:hypothetical protein